MSIKSWLVAIPLALAVGAIVSPAFSQDMKTGEGQRGTKVAPSTNPSTAGTMSNTGEVSKTGEGPRGTKVGPSTQHQSASGSQSMSTSKEKPQ